MFQDGQDILAKETTQKHHEQWEDTKDNWNGWKMEKGSQADVYVRITPCKTKEHCEYGKKSNSNTEQIIGILNFSSLLIVSFFVVTVLCCKKKKVEEDPQIDENYYYGDGGNMDSIRDHRVVDCNDYYD